MRILNDPVTVFGEPAFMIPLLNPQETCEKGKDRRQIRKPGNLLDI